MLKESDLRIIQLLEEDSSLSYADISRKIGIDESTVRKKILKLKEEGVIERFSVLVNPDKLGMRNTAIVGVDGDPVHLLEIAEKLKALSEVKYVALTSGDHMIMIEVWCKDGAQLSHVLMDKIARIEGVRKVCPSMVLQKIKG